VLHGKPAGNRSGNGPGPRRGRLQSKISELALSAGLTDLSRLNRSYRRFEETPATTRANAALTENR
jgi:hypothetical protein